MSDPQWERELAELDRRLASVPETPPTPPAGTPAALPPARGAPVSTATSPDANRRANQIATPPTATSAARTVGTPVPTGRRSWRAQFALLFRLALGVAVVAALIYWPYSARCGIELGYYLGLVAALGIVGLITSTSAWRHRSSVVHLLGLAMLAGALTLGAREILPKVGYAIPTLAHPASWTCAVPSLPATGTPTPATSAPTTPATGAPVSGGGPATAVPTP